MLKILLIDTSSTWLAKREEIRDIEQVSPPIGLMYIATYLKNKLNDHVQVKVINRIVDYVSRQELEAILKEYNPDIAGMRGLTIYKKTFHETAAIIKHFKNSVVVVGGGPYVTMNLQSAMQDEDIDYFVIGEGEIVFCEMIERLLSNKSLSGIAGLVCRGAESRAGNNPHRFIKELDSLPFPDYNLISVEKYGKWVNYGFTKRRHAAIFSSRGCPYECIFCHNIFGKKFRARSPLNVFSEIESLYNKFHIKDFLFCDDSFALDYDRATEIFDLIIKSGLKINIHLTNGIRGDNMDHKFIDKMVRAGVVNVSYYVETASPRLQSFIKKSLDLEKVTENIHYTCEKNIMVNCGVMVGFPSETREEALQTVEYLKQFKKIVFPIFFSVKYHQSPQIYDLAIKYGVKAEDIEGASYEPYHGIRHSGTPLIPGNEIRSIFLKFLNEIFFSRERLLNAIEIQKRFLTKEEILDMYSLFFNKRIKNIDKDILSYVK